MQGFSLLILFALGGPVYEGNAQFEAQMDLAARQRRPLVVFMGDCMPVKEPEDIWIAAYKPLPMPAITVYMPDDRGSLSYAAWTTNVEDVRRIIREEVVLRGCKTHVPTPNIEWDEALRDWVMRRVPKRMPR